MFKILLSLLLPLSLFSSTSSTDTNIQVYFNDAFFSFNNNIMSLPEYMANYLVSISVYFLALLVLFQVIIISYQYFTSGFNIQQVRPMFFNFIVSSSIVTVLIFLPGVKTIQVDENGSSKTVHSKLIVDLTSSLFAAGSEIANLFSYEILFGGITHQVNNLFTEEGLKNNAPNKNQKLNGFITKLVQNNVMNIKNKLEVKVKKFNPSTMDIVNYLEALSSPTNFENYQLEINNIKKNIQTLSNSNIRISSVSNSTSLIENRYDFNLDGVNINTTIIGNGTDSNTLNTFYKKVNHLISNYYKNKVFKPLLNLDKKIIYDTNHLINVKGLLLKENYNPYNLIINKYKDLLSYKNTDLENYVNNYASYPLEQQKDIYNKMKIDIFTPSGLNGYSLDPDKFNNNFQKVFKNVVDNSLELESNENKYFNHPFDIILINKYLKYLENVSNNINNSQDIQDVIKNWKISMQQKNNSIKVIKTNITKMNALIDKMKNNKNMIPSMTLNDLYQKSSILQIFKVFPIIGPKMDSIIKKYSNLPDDYRFYWFDLGRYFLGIKTLLANQMLTNGLFNEITLDNNLNPTEMELLSKCLDNPELPSCKKTSFNTMKGLEGITGSAGVLAGVGATVAITSGFLAAMTTSDAKYVKVGLMKTLGTMANLIIYVLFAIAIIIIANVIMPVIFWYLGVINWFLKSTILLVTFSFTTIFLILDNRKQQVINNVFMILGQAMIPLFMVGIFFLIIDMSIMIDIVAYHLIPLNSFNDILNNSTNGLGLDQDTLSFIPKLIKLFSTGILLIITTVLNLSLYMYLFNIDEFVSEAIGTNVSNNIIKTDKIVRNFGVHHFA